MRVGDRSSVSQWLQGGMKEAGAVQPLGEPSCPSCGTGNSHLRSRSNISGLLGVPGALPAQPPHSSTRVPPWNSLGALHDHQLGSPRRAGDHLCPGVAPRGTVHPKGNAWICVKFQRKNTFPSPTGSLHFPCGVSALHHSIFSLLLPKMYSRKTSQGSPDLEV